MVNGRWKQWSVQDDWAGRLEQWDAEIDRQRRQKFLKAQFDAVERHQRACTAAVTVATVPIRAVLNRLADPAFQAALEAQSPLLLLRETWRALGILPAVITAERLSLGLTTAEIVLDEHRAHLARERSIADAIVADPHLTDLAVELLAGVAKPPREDSGQ